MSWFIIIVSILVFLFSFNKKKAEKQDVLQTEENEVSSYPFAEQEELNNSYATNVRKNITKVDNSKQVVLEKNDTKSKVVSKEDKEKFSLRKAVVYSAILNRPYDENE